jgi:hypothetical protein
MLDLMTQLLESAGEVGETSSEFFSLYRKLVEPEDRKLYLTVKVPRPNLKPSKIN